MGKIPGTGEESCQQLAKPHRPLLQTPTASQNHLPHFAQCTVAG
jgi:hypothetical protein